MKRDELKTYAIAGVTAEIERLQEVLGGLRKTATTTYNGKRGRPPGGSMSAAARKRQSLRMKRFWAERRKRN